MSDQPRIEYSSQPPLMAHSELDNTLIQSSTTLDNQAYPQNAGDYREFGLQPESPFPKIPTENYAPQSPSFTNAQTKLEFGFPLDLLHGNTRGDHGFGVGPEVRPPPVDREHGHSRFESKSPSFGDVGMEPESGWRPRDRHPGNTRGTHRFVEDAEFHPPQMAEVDRKRGHSMFESECPSFGDVGREQESGWRPRDRHPENTRGTHRFGEEPKFLPQMAKVDRKRGHSRFEPECPSFGDVRMEQESGLQPRDRKPGNTRGTHKFGEEPEFGPQMAKVDRKRGHSRFEPECPSFGDARIERESGLQPRDRHPGNVGRMLETGVNSKSTSPEEHGLHFNNPFYGNVRGPREIGLQLQKLPPGRDRGHHESKGPFEIPLYDRRSGFESEGPPDKMARESNNRGFRTKGYSPNIPVWEPEIDRELQPQDAPFGNAAVERKMRLQAEGSGQKPGFGLQSHDEALGNGVGSIRSSRVPEVPKWDHERALQSPPRISAGKREHGSPAPRKTRDGRDFQFKPPSPPRGGARGDRERQGQPHPWDSGGDHEQQPETSGTSRKPKRGAPTTSDFEVQSIKEYILKKGGPSCIHTMLINDRVTGWRRLADLKKCLQKQQEHGGVATVPKWYSEFLTEFGYPNPYIKGSMEEPQPPNQAASPATPLQRSKLQMCSPLEGLEGSGEPLYDSREILSKPAEKKVVKPKLQWNLTTSDPEVHLACKYIVEHGGPECIEKFALPDKSVPGDVNVLLFVLQRHVKRCSEGTFVDSRPPKWYKHFLREHGFPIKKWPSSKVAGAGSGPESRQKRLPYRSEVNDLVEYIMENGGPKNVDTMTIPDTMDPNCRSMLSVLQQIIANSRKNGRNQLVLPGWFAQFLIDYGLPAPSISKSDAFDAADEEPPTSTDYLKDPKQLKEYILRRGGHLSIEMIPVNSAIPGWKLLYSLQTTIKDMKKKGITYFKGGVRAYPPWYHGYLAQYEPDKYVPIPGIDDLCPVKEGSSQYRQPAKGVMQALVDHIMQHGGPSAIETMPLPEKNRGFISKLRMCIINQKNNAVSKHRVTSLPVWYKRFLLDKGFDPQELYPDLVLNDQDLHPVEAEPEQPASIWEPALPPLTALDEPSSVSYPPGKEITRKGRRFAYNYTDLVNYILENGGPDNLEKMSISTSPLKETCKVKLTHVQQMLQKMKEGIGIKLPDWYIDFLDDYGFATPTVFTKDDESQQRVKHVDLTELKKYILKNGGHSKIATMHVDHGVVNAKYLKKLVMSLRGQIRRGGINYYPDWYFDYLAEYEPDVKLPDHVTRKDSVLPGGTESGDDNEGQDQNKDKPWRSPSHPSGPAKGTIPNPPGTSQPSAQVASKLGLYIMSNGGPSEIEKMTLPPVGYLGRSNFAKLQKTVMKQRIGDPLYMWLPIWYKKFLREYGFDAKELYPHLTDEQLAIPPDKEDQPSDQKESDQPKPGPAKQLVGEYATGVSRSPEEILTDPKVQSAMKYVEDNGGPECLDSMPAPTKDSGVDGWQLVCRLQNGLINQKMFNDKINLLPVWYILLLMRRGEPVPSKQYVDRFGRTHLSVNSLGEPLETLDPPPFDFSTFDPETYGKLIPPQLADYIQRNGGHANLENIPVDYSVPGFRLLQKLQKNIIKQKKGRDGTVWRYPPWYRQYLAEYEPNVELPPRPPKEDEAASLPAESKCQPKTSTPPADSGPLKKAVKPSDAEPQSMTTKHATSQKKTGKPSDSEPQPKSTQHAESQKKNSKFPTKTATNTESGSQKKTVQSAESVSQKSTMNTGSKSHAKASAPAESGSRKKAESTPNESESGPRKNPTKSADYEPQWMTAMRQLPRCQVVLECLKIKGRSDSATSNSEDSKPRPKTSTPTESGHQKNTESTPAECESGPRKKNTISTDSESQQTTTAPAESETQKKNEYANENPPEKTTTSKKPAPQKEGSEPTESVSLKKAQSSPRK